MDPEILKKAPLFAGLEDEAATALFLPRHGKAPYSIRAMCSFMKETWKIGSTSSSAARSS